MEDRDGNMWAGTSEGLNRLVPRRIMRVTDLGLVTGVESATDGHVWVGTIDELVRCLEAEGFEVSYRRHQRPDGALEGLGLFFASRRGTRD